MILTSKIIDNKKFEELLVSNWTQFIHYNKLRELLQNQNPPINAKKISISRFEPIESGFIVWIEYTDSISSGTLEIHLSNFGIPSQAKIY